MSQGSIPSPRTQKIQGQGSSFEDRPSQGQGQECSRPRTQRTRKKVFAQKKSQTLAKFQAFSKKEKRSPKFFREVSDILQDKKKVCPWPIFNKSKNYAVFNQGWGFSRT